VRGGILFAVTVQEVDGRTARANRTREAVVEALLSLMEEGDVQPTAAQIAARAGVSERTLFQHFHDREALFLAVAARQTERFRERWERISSDGPFEERLDAFVEQRSGILELATPVRRGALLMEPFSETVAESLKGFRRLKRDEAARIFRPELEALPEGERPAARAALGMVASWSAWEELRRHQGLSQERAKAALRRSVAGALGRA
jgi:TetR/AcrR family transcriptional regulator, regulator of autoinduction and epiphytic fitness